MDVNAGSYVIDANGDIRPNENDEAMTGRYGLKKAATADAAACQETKTEVNDIA